MTSSAASAPGEKVIQSSDGTDIFVKQFVADSPKAQILLTHGYLEHCLRYQEFAEYMIGKGISVTVYDCRGHGRSGGARAFIDSWEDYAADFEAVRSTIHPPDELSTFVMGHSMGGLVTLDYHLRAASDGCFPDDVKGIILSSPYLKPAKELPYMKVLLGKVFGRVMPSITIPSGLKEEDLMNDPQKQKEHKDDPLVLKDATAGWALQCMIAQERAQKLAEAVTLPVPVLFSYGAADPVASPDMNKEVGEKLRVEDKTVLRREGDLHEPLNETKREELFETIANWVTERG
uniref:Serine aminopeptidase S33 domain-containing protein n=1 Tax=Odontella aurita TaxID=265563 RepID=A0A7S4JRL3_9STRA|mmetsp:Transcript_51871/g.155674  ORF Transcript_51871/g.155674 Transcript_51871/m.155674 type:complete len:290 (+) Transcript_51871:350-1219(+)|eukprot:CAMPEP_0113531914 /NCGR_PEP_ID=MMETSP0015_2-20120614/3760_1 /TAXON_ID=2838 /ORGANISM="Odontella" /LENGTH=289 /DNA_ID=CAMNT_0000430801 /DNA_START=266 /DNA_END=1135 /DNA_ORIENTATION=- /assembly_acc=CAM_ASM_000160